MGLAESSLSDTSMFSLRLGFPLECIKILWRLACTYIIYGTRLWLSSKLQKCYPGSRRLVRFVYTVLLCSMSDLDSIVQIDPAR